MKKKQTTKEWEEEMAKAEVDNAPMNAAMRAGLGMVGMVETKVGEGAVFMNKLLRRNLSPEDVGLESDDKGQPIRNEDGTYKKAKAPVDANAGAGTGVQPRGKRKLTMNQKLRIVADQKTINIEDLEDL